MYFCRARVREEGVKKCGQRETEKGAKLRDGENEEKSMRSSMRMRTARLSIVCNKSSEKHQGLHLVCAFGAALQYACCAHPPPIQALCFFRCIRGVTLISHLKNTGKKACGKITGGGRWAGTRFVWNLKCEVFVHTHKAKPVVVLLVLHLN